MGRVQCKNCDKKQGILGDMTIERWYRCPKCGPICPSCDNRSGFMGMGGKVCPKCGKKLEKL